MILSQISTGNFNFEMHYIHTYANSYITFSLIHS